MYRLLLEVTRCSVASTVGVDRVLGWITPRYSSRHVIFIFLGSRETANCRPDVVINKVEL